MLRKQLITFGLSITALLAVLLLFGMTVSTAKASVDYPAPFTDSFSSYPTNWVEAPTNPGSGGRTGFLTFNFGTGNCFSGDCIGADNGGSLFVGLAGRTSTGYSQGAFVFYAKTNGGGFYDISPCRDNGSVGSFGCGASGTSGEPLEGLGFNSSIGTQLLTDGAYHKYAFLWRVEPITGTYYDFCQLIDTEDPTTCSWTTSSATVAGGDIFGFFMRTDSWNTSGRYLYIDDISELSGPPPVDDSTRIESITPPPDQTVASSTSFTFGSSGYVATEDWTEDTVLYIRWRQQTGFGIRGNGAIGQSGEITIPIVAPGAFNLSTTTSVTNSGVYIGYVAIQKPRFSLFGFNFFTETLESNTWLFTVATSTARELESTVLLLSTTGGGNTIASTTLAIGNLNACQNFLSGSTTECLISIVVPSGEQLTGAASVMNTALSNNLPFSMFWQPYTQLKTISASTTPFAGTDVEVNMHNTFINGTTTLFSWADAKDTVDEAIPDSAVLYLVYAEWIIFGLYCIWRLTRQIS